MDIPQLRYVVALSQELHFLRAAKRAHVSQPSLSQALKKLEVELGVPLFERSPKGVQPTAEGKKFLPFAIAALDNLQTATRELQELRREIMGTLRIGVIPTICPYLMPEVIRDLKRSAPKLVLELSEETTSVLLSQIKDGTLDLGILALPVAEKGLAERVFYREPLYLAVSKNHPLATRKTVTSKDITAQKVLVLKEGHCFGRQMLDFCNISRETDQVIFQGSSLTSVIRLAALGEGITLVPKMASLIESAPGIRFIPFSSKQPFREIGVTWRLTAPLNRAAHFLIETVEKILKQQPA